MVNIGSSVSSHRFGTQLGHQRFWGNTPHPRSFNVWNLEIEENYLHGGHSEFCFLPAAECPEQRYHQLPSQRENDAKESSVLLCVNSHLQARIGKTEDSWQDDRKPSSLLRKYRTNISHFLALCWHFNSNFLRRARFWHDSQGRYPAKADWGQVLELWTPADS